MVSGDRVKNSQSPGCIRISLQIFLIVNIGQQGESCLDCVLSKVLVPECTFTVHTQTQLPLGCSSEKASFQQPRELTSNPRPRSSTSLLLGIWVVLHLAVVCVKENNIYNSFLFGHLNGRLCQTEFDPLHSVAASCHPGASYWQQLVSQSRGSSPPARKLPRPLIPTLTVFMAQVVLLIAETGGWGLSLQSIELLLFFFFRIIFLLEAHKV